MNKHHIATLSIARSEGIVLTPREEPLFARDHARFAKIQARETRSSAEIAEDEKERANIDALVERGEAAFREKMRRCVAPISDDADPKLCGEPGTTTREIEGVTCALCAKHAVEVDADELPDPHTPAKDGAA